jgi:hypothetical protein
MPDVAAPGGQATVQDPMGLMMACIVVAAIWGCSNPFLKLGTTK